MRRLAGLLLCLFLSGFVYSQTIVANGATSFCVGGSVTLTITGVPGGSGFQWQKDGSDIPGATNASFVANATGAYTVIVTQGGNSNTYGPTNITASTPPTPSFTSSPNNQCGTVPVNFTNTTLGSSLTYSWNFGDPNSGTGNTSTQTNPSHTFVGNPGNSTQNFTVSLAADNAGCIRSFTSTVTIKQRPDPRLAGPGAGTFDGKPYFKVCSNAQTAPFTFSNTSTTSATNTNYTIVWGDGSADYSSNTFPAPVTHTYSIGTTTMLFIVDGQNGCRDTATYNIFLGTNPAVGLGNPGSTSICTGDSLTFPISNTSSNSPGTVYTVTFNDGTPSITFPHPAPQNITHTFLLTSCGVNSPGYNNSFAASIQARNPCQTSSATVVPIYVSQKSKASFSISQSDTICVNNALTVTNTSGNIAFIDNGSCTNGKVIWKVTPATGWSVNVGSLGNDFGLSDAANWLSGTASVQFSFTTPGTYSIKLKTGNPNCGNDSVIRVIC
ncbi:MAG TPA: PKD domain-containing protein, partial [Flavisolibacter sp.]